MDTQRESGIARLYQTASGLYSSVPYRLFPGGYAFPPIHYYLEVTRRCNLRCRMCQYARWLHETPVTTQKEGELTTDEWKRVIDQTNRLGLLTFTGGEPWLRSDFLELLEYACSKRLTHCISNAVLLTEDRARRCVELAPGRFPLKGLLSVGVSLDAPGDRHDEIRGQAGAFEKATHAVRTLTQLRDARGQRWPMVHVTSVIQQANLDVLPQMPSVVRDIGADVLNLTIEIRFHDLDGIGDVDPATIRASDIAMPRIDRATLEQVLADTRKAADAAGVALRLPRMPIEEIVQYYCGGLNLAKFQCRTPWTTLFVGCKGDVFPCFIRKIGNIREQRLGQLWNGPEMCAFRKRCHKGLWPVCQGCCEMQYHG
jgi:MoaA/NifB/PqqE/SkfB family radical SAM enzyme